MKITLLIVLFACILPAAYGQSSGSFKLNFQYSQTQRPELNDYFAELSDTLQINEVLNIDPGFGFGVGMIFGSNAMEFEAGGSYTFSVNQVGSEAGNLVYYKNADITYYFGANYLPVNFFLVGGSFVINSANAKSNCSGIANGATLFESLPSTNFHIFRGYAVALKAQSGFYINLNKDDGNRMRLTGFYTYGISNYNFYTVSEKRLENYSGEQKTNFTTAGIELAILFGMF